MYNILIIEDDKCIADLLRLNLEMYGFTSTVALDGEKGLDKINDGLYDLIVLDIMMPKLTGYDLLPYIQKKEIPVIILTAKESLDSKIKGFTMGADDYMTKPFEAVELIARINAVLKRNGQVSKVRVGFDNIIIDFTNRQIIKDNKPIDVTLREYELLCYLVENQGIALSREVLLEKVWNYDYAGNTRTVDMHIQKLRSKLETDRIGTVFKYGYRFEK